MSVPLPCAGDASESVEVKNRWRNGQASVFGSLVKTVVSDTVKFIRPETRAGFKPCDRIR
jgi:hypothetical protein